MIELQNISWTAPNGKKVLTNVNLKIHDHHLTAISGPNGSGKTTLGKIIMGMEKPTSGRIFMDGEDITDLDVTSRAKKGISFGFQQPIHFKGITIRNILNIAAGRILNDEHLCMLLQRVGLCAKTYLDRDVDATLSGGELKRIEIATILARNTDFVIFDEPEAGIDLWSFKNLIEVFDEMRASGEKTIVIVSHQERILRIADEIVMIDHGTIVDHGPGPAMMSKIIGGKGLIKKCCGNAEVNYE